MNLFSEIFDYILDIIYTAFEWVMNLLPDSPIQNSDFLTDMNGTFTNVMGYINYFVPVGTMLGIFTAYLTAVAVWYVVRWFMRLSRYID